jgi:hypothetical protein
MQSQPLKPELIVMLTHHDQTVQNSLELFQRTKDYPIKHWGFKDVGLPPEEMQKIVNAMKDAGKITFLEVVSLSEEDGLRGAELAVELGFDVLMGTVFFPSIAEYLKDKSIQYYPFPGKVHSHPSILDGSIDEIVAHARQLEAYGAHGLDLLTYRFNGEASHLLKLVVDATNIPIVSAGSIASFERIREVWDAGAWGFTIGSAFFERQFVPDGSFEENVMAVCDWLEKQ